MPFDSAPDALAAQREVWRRIGPAARIRLAIEMSDAVRRVALAGARSRQPALSDAELLRRQLRSLYGLERVAPSSR
jgi:DUF1365 family protein